MAAALVEPCEETIMPSLKRASALMVISLLVYIGYGLSLARYVPERSNAYLWGVYHVHSALSDGLLPPHGIAKAAKQSNVGLVLLTDHGTPHFETTTYRAEPRRRAGCWRF